MYSIRKSIDVDFAHHVRGHDGPCINVHGHTWKLEVVIEAAELDESGFVIDFGKLKREGLIEVYSAHTVEIRDMEAVAELALAD